MKKQIHQDAAPAGNDPRPFEYLGKVFTPVITNERYNWKKLSSKLWGGGETLKPLDCINENGYKHEDFYKIAKAHGCGKVDVFELDGEKVIPCNRLMYYGQPSWYGKEPPPPAGNDLPKQLSYEGNGKETYDLILGGRIIAELHTGEDEAIEICKAFNDFPALQEQNKELLEALKEIVSEYEAFSDVPANLKSFPGYTGENTREQAMVRALNLISKYSK